MPSLRSSIILKISDTLLFLTSPPVLVWLWMMLVSAEDPKNPLWTGYLHDPDDYLYLVQALDWLKGQNWYDLIQHRMNPPQGMYMHYSHLLSGFYGGIIFLLHTFLSFSSAALVTSIIIPPIYLAGLLFSLRWLGQKMVDPKWGGMTAYFVLFSPALLPQYALGHIDHHGLEALLAVVAFCGMTIMMTRPSAFLGAAATGLVLALGLVIGLEMLPFAALFCLGIGGWAMIQGGVAARSGFVFGASFFLSNVGFLLVTRPPAEILVPDIPVYSIVYVLLAGSIALCFSGVAVADRFPAAMRYIAGGVLACVTAWVFLCWFPQLKEGPYGGVDPMVAKLIYLSGDESWPIIGSGAAQLRQYIPFLFPPILAAGASIMMLARAPDRARRCLWGMMFIVISVFIALTAFYQCRLFYYAQTFATVALTGVVWHDWTHRPAKADKARRILWILRLAVVLLAGPVTFAWGASGPAGISDDMATENRQTLRRAKTTSGCDVAGLAEFLDDPQGYGSHPRLIMNSINEGPELLFRTPHTVLAGPYHMNASGNLDATRFFTTSEPAVARAIAQRRGAELIVICNEDSQLRMYENMKNDMDATGTTFIQQLIDRKIPAWLKPIESPKFDNVLLFEIHGDG